MQCSPIQAAQAESRQCEVAVAPGRSQVQKRKRVRGSGGRQRSGESHSRVFKRAVQVAWYSPRQ